MNGGPRTLRLLWPAGVRAAGERRLSDEAAADLGLDAVITALVGSTAPGGRRAARERFIRRTLTELVTDETVITHRQAVLRDLLEEPRLREQLAEVLPSLEALGDPPAPQRFRPSAVPEPSLERVARRLGELELLLDVVVRLDQALGAGTWRSTGLRDLTAEIAALRGSEAFRALERELPGLRATLASVRSVTIGLNLGPDLQPQSATILGLSDQPIEGRRGLLERLLGGSGAGRGLSPLQRGEAGPLGRPNELVRDLRHLLGQVVGPVEAALGQYASVSSATLSQLGLELALLLGAAGLIERLRCAGLPVCCPEVLPLDERRASAEDAYDVRLALAQLERGAVAEIVTNPVSFDAEAGRVWVLTGPNRGGKTTYTRAVGLLQVLLQAGLFVPARAARLSPVELILTHFPTREDAIPGQGRLDAEAERLATIFRQARPSSLILLNEALAGTSALEALDLARGIVRALRLLGARAIYVTHLHELALATDEINASTPGDGTVGSLVAEADEAGPGVGRRTYRIAPGHPRGASFAAEIAEQHGISFDHLARLIRDRQDAPASGPQ